MNTQTQALTKTAAQTPNGKPSALAVMASRVNVDPAKLLDTLKATVFKNASTEELLALVVVSNEYHLNPFLKEIYAFPAKGGGIVPVVSVDGWNKMLIRQDNFDGIEFETVSDETGAPISCTSIISIKNRSKPVKITEYFEECFRDTDNWRRMPRRMLRHRALCQGSRVAFGFAGVYSEDEAQDFIDISSSVAPKGPPPKLVQVAEPPGPTQADLARAGFGPPPEPAEEATIQAQLADFVIKECASNFDDLKKWTVTSGAAPELESCGSFDEIPNKLATRLFRAKVVLKQGLTTPEVAA